MPRILGLKQADLIKDKFGDDEPGKGRNRDNAWFSMLDREWPARKAAFERWLAPENFDADGKQKRSLSALNASH